VKWESSGIQWMRMWGATCMATEKETFECGGGGGVHLGTYGSLTGQEGLVLGVTWAPVDQDVGRNL
jgi:hypothetical protein